MATKIQIRRDTTSNWSSANPVLSSGELGINLTTGQFKIGDGSTAWNSLNYFIGYLAGGSLDDLSDVTITSAASGDFLRWNGTAWINDAVNLGSDTIGNYVSDVTAGTGVSVTHTPGEGSSPTIAIGQAVGTSDSPSFIGVTAGTVNLSGAGGNIRFEGVNVDGKATTLEFAEPTNTRQIFFPDAGGTVALLGTIALGTDTTGNYVSDVTAGTAISVSHTPGEGSSPSVSLNAELNDLNDVVVSGPEKYQTLAYDGAGWVQSYSPVVSYVRNAEATTLTVGTAVYLFGGTGDHASVKRADNSSDATSSKTIGLVGASITANNNGPVVTRGYVQGMDLSAYSEGDILWLGSNGAFTKTKPTAPNHLVFVGVVVRATNNGIIYVATQNGFEIDELHDVRITSKTSGDFLKYDGTNWVNDQINLGTDTVGNYVNDLTAGFGITVAHTPAEGSSPTVAVDTLAIATVSYVDSVAAGINWHEAVDVATIAPLPDSPTYSNGTAGVGATLTASANGLLTVDDLAVGSGDRVLVKNQANAVHNGIYVVTNPGTPAAAYVLTRASDTNNSVPGQVKAGDAVFVTSGGINANQGFILTTEGTGTNKAHILGTDNLSYTQFTGTANIVAGTGLSKSGNTLSLDADLNDLTNVDESNAYFNGAQGTLLFFNGTNWVATRNATYSQGVFANENSIGTSEPITGGVKGVTVTTDGVTVASLGSSGNYQTIIGVSGLEFYDTGTSVGGFTTSKIEFAVSGNSFEIKPPVSTSSSKEVLFQDKNGTVALTSDLRDLQVKFLMEVM